MYERIMKRRSSVNPITRQENSNKPPKKIEPPNLFLLFVSTVLINKKIQHGLNPVFSNMEGCRVSSCQSDSLGFLVWISPQDAASTFQANTAILQQFADDAQPFERTACHHAMRHQNEKYQSSTMIRAPAGCSVSWKSEHLMIMLQISWQLVCEAVYFAEHHQCEVLLYRRQCTFAF